MEVFSEFKQKLQKGLKVTLNYSFIILGMIVSFTIGYYYDALKEIGNQGKPEFIKRKDVTIAIDESSNLMVIKKVDGSYTLLQDSVGQAIFDLYAKNIWSQHQPSSNEGK
jgi:hypothetical protein